MSKTFMGHMSTSCVARSPVTGCSSVMSGIRRYDAVA